MNLTHRMTATITLSSVASRATGGDQVYSANRTIKAMQEDCLEIIRNIKGKDIAVSTKLATHDEIKYDDRVWLDGENPATVSAKVPQVIKSATALDGTKLYEVKL